MTQDGQQNQAGDMVNMAISLGRIETTLAMLVQQNADLAAQNKANSDAIARQATFQAELGVRVAAIEETHRSENARRPTWMTSASGIAAIVSTIVAVLALGGVIKIG